MEPTIGSLRVAVVLVDPSTTAAVLRVQTRSSVSGLPVPESSLPHRPPSPVPLSQSRSLKNRRRSNNKKKNRRRRRAPAWGKTAASSTRGALRARAILLRLPPRPHPLRLRPLTPPFLDPLLPSWVDPSFRRRPRPRRRSSGPRTPRRKSGGPLRQSRPRRVVVKGREGVVDADTVVKGLDGGVFALGPCAGRLDSQLIVGKVQTRN
uniref:Uncharacterized protein n=1 Tax=Setaria viridis TaxID=4556 RepID=A0A4U6U783_SETVI|nr:hypothetical protein SEVIR_6G161000v2 [Setaria viridis]